MQRRMPSDSEGSEPQVIDIEKMIKEAVDHAFKVGWSKIALSGPGDTMYYEGIRERTNFGQLLHKEGLWSLYKFDEGRSLLYHLCRGYAGLKQENSPADPRDGQCSACESPAPDEIRGLWTLHNFEWIQRGGVHNDV